VDNITSLVCAVVTVVVLTIVPAVYPGLRTYRWGSSETLRQAADRLEALPRHIGLWTCDESAALDEEVMEGLQCESAFSRTYSNQKNTAKVHCILMVGLPGPIVRHPPEFCYAVRDNVLLDQRVVTFNSKSVKHAARLTRFQEPRILKREFFVATGWFADGHLGTSDFPRMTYGGEAYIYAIQVMWPIDRDLEDCEAVGISFLKDFMPAFQSHCVKPVAETVTQ